MLKMLKWIIRLALVVAIIFGVGYVYFNYFESDPKLSTAQAEIIESLGAPEQFAITYLPKGSEEGSEFIRQEVWFYPSILRKVSFLGGEVVATEELEIADNVKYDTTQLKPEDFDFYTSLKDVEKQVGKINLAPLELPGFFSEGVETYASRDAMFVFEEGYLTYMETLD